MEQSIENPKIAIVKLSSFGDIIHALPVLCAIKKQIPGSQISWLVEAPYKELLENHPCLSDVIIVDTKAIRKGFTRLSKYDDLWKDIRTLRETLLEKKFDIAIDLQGLIKSGLVTYATGAKKRIGFYPGACRESLSALFYNNWAHPEPDFHIFDKNLSCIKNLGLETKEIEFKLTASQEDIAWARNWLESHNVLADKGAPLVLISPGTRWETKKWPLENYISLVKSLLDWNINVLLTGGAQEEAVSREIGSKVSGNIILAIGYDLKKLMGLISISDLIIASDSGPLHLAGALGKKTLSFFGPSSPKRSGWRGGDHIVFYPAIPCGGCNKRTCADIKCMREIRGEEVIPAVLKALGIN